MIDSGTMEDRVFFYKLKDSVEKSRLPDESDFELFRGCWANIRSISVRDQIRSGLEIQDQTYTVLCRYFKGLNASVCRMKIWNKWFLITSIEPDKKNDEMIISVSIDIRLNKNEGFTT